MTKLTMKPIRDYTDEEISDLGGVFCVYITDPGGDFGVIDYCSVSDGSTTKSKKYYPFMSKKNLDYFLHSGKFKRANSKNVARDGSLVYDPKYNTAAIYKIHYNGDVVTWSGFLLVGDELDRLDSGECFIIYNYTDFKDKILHSYPWGSK